MTEKQPTAAEQIAAASAMLRTLAALAADAEQYTLLEEPLVRKTFVKQQSRFQLDALHRVLRTLEGKPPEEKPIEKPQEEFELCPENATTSKSQAEHLEASAPAFWHSPEESPPAKSKASQRKPASNSAAKNEPTASPKNS